MENNIIFKEEYTFDDLIGKNNHRLRFDYAIFNKNNNLDFLLEFDGIQHYINDSTFFSNNEQVKRYDKIKDEYCKNHNIKLVRIPYYEMDIISYDYIMKAAGY